MLDLETNAQLSGGLLDMQSNMPANPMMGSVKSSQKQGSLFEHDNGGQMEVVQEQPETIQTQKVADQPVESNQEKERRMATEIASKNANLSEDDL